MLSIFTHLKPFSDPHIATIQRNAIMSWKLLRPMPEILVFGDRPGVAEICSELDLRHIPAVRQNEYGRALISDLFVQAQKLATYDLLCFTNGDIIFTGGIVEALNIVSRRFANFLVTGRRWGLHQFELIDYQDANWEATLLARTRAFNDLHPENALDYFSFRRGAFPEIPDFAIGRPGWDNWLITHASRRNLAVIDVTPRVTMIHQEHDYTLAGGWQTYATGPEAQRNRELAMGLDQQASIYDASFVLTASGISAGWPRRWRAKARRIAYELLVYRTGPIRHKLGLRRSRLRT